jgi:streptomycin 6-kinase
MTSREFELPEPVRLRAESLGRPGVQWLAGLGESVGYLEDKWSVDVCDVLSGGSESLVAEAVLGDGTGVIVKIGLPGSADLAMEAKVYRLAAGRGYANLIAHDASHNALLMERLGAPLAETGISIQQQIRRICATLQDAWIPITHRAI